MTQLNWRQLLSDQRRKDLGGGQQLMDTGIGREEIERDYDRILFLAPTRRLADKTQVFPMEVMDSVRNRLTHSYEVSNLARSIGTKLVYDHREKVFGESCRDIQLERKVPALLAATGLAHDLGNPPFGHQGEAAIGQWFHELSLIDKSSNTGKFPWKDFTQFDGNRQTFRLLTKLQILNDNYGLNLTCATLAALLKYPSFCDTKSEPVKKWGVFQSERSAAAEVWSETGLGEGVRHPLAYVMEACDDIAYSVIDAEDTVKKGYASYYDLIGFLQEDPDCSIAKVLGRAATKHKDFKKAGLSSAELNELSMQMFRVAAIAQMIEDATNSFVEYIDRIMNSDLPDNFELIKHSDSGTLCAQLKNFDRQHGFEHKDVLKLELEGNNYIKQTMDLLWIGIDADREKPNPFEKYAYGRISENYRRVYEATKKTRHDKCHLLCDAISGMTEPYLINLHRELSRLK